MSQFDFMKSSYENIKDYIKTIFDQLSLTFDPYDENNSVDSEVISNLSVTIENLKKPIIMILNKEEYCLKIYACLIAGIHEKQFMYMLRVLFENIEENLLPLFSNLNYLANAINFQIIPRKTNFHSEFDKMVYSLFELKLDLQQFSNNINGHYEPNEKLKGQIKNFISFKRNDYEYFKSNLKESFKIEFLAELMIEIESINYDLLYNFEIFEFSNSKGIKAKETENDFFDDLIVNQQINLKNEINNIKSTKNEGKDINSIDNPDYLLLPQKINRILNSNKENIPIIVPNQIEAVKLVNNSKFIGSSNNQKITFDKNDPKFRTFFIKDETLKYNDNLDLFIRNYPLGELFPPSLYVAKNSPKG